VRILGEGGSSLGGCPPVSNPMQTPNVFFRLHTLVIDLTLFVVSLLFCCKLIVHEWKSLRRAHSSPQGQESSTSVMILGIKDAHSFILGRGRVAGKVRGGLARVASVPQTRLYRQLSSLHAKAGPWRLRKVRFATTAQLEEETLRTKQYVESLKALQATARSCFSSSPAFRLGHLGPALPPCCA
jgi:hypothetical protein